MPKDSMHKLKLLYLADLFRSESDEDHPLTIADMTRALAAHGISAERKSLYSDIELLKQYGMDIVTVKVERANGYALVSRELEMPECKLLVDAVQSSKFITRKKSSELIAKIESLVSRYQANKLDRQVYVANRVKTMNESIYYTVDDIHTAILENRKIRFRYFDRNMRKEKVLRHDGAYYTVSPWALTWDDENYYLIAYDSAVGDIRHYRVDKMLRITATGQPRDGRDKFRDFDMAVYSSRTFGMFGGQLECVVLDCADELAGVIIDRFGQDVTIVRREGHFETTVNVMVSPMFLSWVVSFGGRMKILSPGTVKNAMAELCGSTMAALN